MVSFFRHHDPDQAYLLPPNLRDWLPEDHLVYFIEHLVEQLDLSAIIAPYQESTKGQPAYDPQMMTKVLFYGYATNTRSSRQIEKKIQEDIGFRVLAAGSFPDHSTINNFRKNHLKALAGLFAQMVQLCRQADLVGEKTVGIDGTKIQANASRHKAMSYGRMKTEHRRLKDEIEKALEEASRIDDEEDEKGLGVPNRLGPDFNTKKKRLEKIEKAMRDLEERTREESGDPQAKPADKAQINFTDPDSRISPRSDNKRAYDQNYNAQAVVDDKALVIVATGLTNHIPDTPHLPPMVEATVESLGRADYDWLGDAGYHSLPNTEMIEGHGGRAFIPPDRQKHNRVSPPAPRGRIPEGLSPPDRMRRKLRTKEGRRIYSRRKAIAEPLFGLIKRVLGFRQFSLRGLEATQSEWRFMAAVYDGMAMLWAGKRGLAA